MDISAQLYAGRVSHIRHTPFQHKFNYRIWMMAIELDAMDTLAASSVCFAHNRFGLLSIHDKDHGFRDGRPLRAYVEEALTRQGFQDYAAKIVFVSIPRLLGYAFNPISFYYCYDAQGKLGAVLHQVKNTFGGQLGYLMSVEDENNIHQSAAKRLRVSPFFDLAGGYHFSLTAPGENLKIMIQYSAAGEKRLTAAMALRARPFNGTSIFRLLLQMPLTPLKVIAAIHFEALRLYLKGAKFHAAPDEKHEPVISGETT
jgi:DUF1365 family protein